MSPSTSAQPASAGLEHRETERLVARRQRVDRRARHQAGERSGESSPSARSPLPGPSVPASRRVSPATHTGQGRLEARTLERGEVLGLVPQPAGGEHERLLAPGERERPRPAVRRRPSPAAAGRSARRGPRASRATGRPPLAPRGARTAPRRGTVPRRGRHPALHGVPPREHARVRRPRAPARATAARRGRSR